MNSPGRDPFLFRTENLSKLYPDGQVHAGPSARMANRSVLADRRLGRSYSVGISPRTVSWPWRDEAPC